MTFLQIYAGNGIGFRLFEIGARLALLVMLVVLAGCQHLATSPQSPTIPASIQETSLKAPSTDPSEAMFPTTLELDKNLFRFIAPSNDRDWTPEQADLTTAEYEGNFVTVHNIRDCQWRSSDDFTVARFDRTYDLKKLRSVDFIVVPFSEIPGVAHTMLSFGFEGGDHLAVSVEVRKQRGEFFNPAAAFFRQYELIYVVATERDVIQRRVICDRCDVYLYRSVATPEQARLLFDDVMKRVNGLARQPEFYDTLVNNCATNIRRHINHLKSDLVPYDYRVLLPNYSDSLAYDLDLIERHGSYAETRRRARVNEAAYLYRNSADFSRVIRDAAERY
jgi:hypothetical protein